MGWPALSTKKCYGKKNCVIVKKGESIYLEIVEHNKAGQELLRGMAKEIQLRFQHQWFLL